MSISKYYKSKLKIGKIGLKKIEIIFSNQILLKKIVQSTLYSFLIPWAKSSKESHFSS